mgnify:CR=1 FL=1
MPRGGRRAGAGRKPKNYALLMAQRAAEAAGAPSTALAIATPSMPPPARVTRARTQDEADEEAARIEKAARTRLQRSTQHNEDLKARYRELGPMPSDPLAAVDHTLRILQTSVDETLEDETLSAKERRSELRQIARSMIPLLPVARLYKAERHIRGAMSATTRNRQDPSVVPVSPAEATLTMDS